MALDKKNYKLTEYATAWSGLDALKSRFNSLVAVTLFPLTQGVTPDKERRALRRGAIHACHDLRAELGRVQRQLERMEP